MKYVVLFLTTVVLFFSGIGYGQEILQWRGANRSGVFNETGLLKSWPQTGPELLWEFAELGNGYGSPVITKTNIFMALCQSEWVNE